MSNDIKDIKTKIAKAQSEIDADRKKSAILSREWYSLRGMLSFQWAMFLFLLGGREAGKSYAVIDFFVNQFINKNRPFTWLRLTDASQKKLLQNNAEKLIDPDIRRRYNLDLMTRCENVYVVLKRDKNGKVLEKKLMCRVLALSTFYNDKGSGLFDADFLKNPDMWYNIALDEMNRELNERKTFDIVYAFANQLENLVRSSKERMRIICIGNTLEEASDILSAFNFLPEEFGRYKLKKKKAVIDYIPLNEPYKRRREGTAANILQGQASTFTNEVKIDNSKITKKRLISPSYVIVFSKEKMFTVWDDNVIAPYNNEKVRHVAMRPYLDEVFIPAARDAVFLQFDARYFLFRNLITQKLFKKELQFLRTK